VTEPQAIERAVRDGGGDRRVTLLTQRLLDRRSAA
jgi:hypothetical protein